LRLTVSQSVSQSVSLLVSQSYFATDDRSVSRSVLALSPSGTHDQILAVVKTVEVLLSWGVLPDGRTGLTYNRSQSLSVTVIYMYAFILHVFFMFCPSLTIFFYYFSIFLGLQSRFCSGGCAEVHILVKGISTV